MIKPLIYNRLTVKNTGEGFHELVALFTKKNGEDATPFNSLVPMPKDIWDAEAVPPDRFKNLFIKHDAKNSREWSGKNWGTMREAHNIKIKHINSDEVLIRFNTYLLSPWAIIETISQKFPQLTFVIDIYSYVLPTTYAAGYAPDFPLHRENLRSDLTSDHGVPWMRISEEFFTFVRRFKGLPIGGDIFRKWPVKLEIYDPADMEDYFCHQPTEVKNDA